MDQCAEFIEKVRQIKSLNELTLLFDTVRRVKNWSWFIDVIWYCHDDMKKAKNIKNVFWAHAILKCMEIMVVRGMAVNDVLSLAIIDAMSILSEDCEALRKYLLPMVKYSLDRNCSSRWNQILTPWSGTSTPDPDLLNVCFAPNNQSNKFNEKSFRFSLLQLLMTWCTAVMRDKTAVSKDLKVLLFTRTFENFNNMKLEIRYVYPFTEKQYTLDGFGGIEEAMVDFSIEMVPENPEVCKIFEPTIKRILADSDQLGRFLEAITVTKLRAVGNAPGLGLIIERLIRFAEVTVHFRVCDWNTTLNEIYGGSTDHFPITEIFLDRIDVAEGKERSHLAGLCLHYLKQLRLDEIDASSMKEFLRERYSIHLLMKMISENMEYIEELGLFGWLWGWKAECNPNLADAIDYASIYYIDRFVDVSPFMEYLEHRFQNNNSSSMPVDFLIEFLKKRFDGLSDNVLKAAMLNKLLVKQFVHEFIGEIKYEPRLSGLLMRSNIGFELHRYGSDVTDWLRKNLRVCAQDTLEERVRKLTITGQYSKPDLFLLFATSKDTELMAHVADLLRGEDFSIDPEYCAKRNVSLQSLMNVAKYQQDLKKNGTTCGTRPASLSSVQWISDVPLELLRVEPAAVDIILSEYFKAFVNGDILPDFEDEWLTDFCQIVRATYFAIDQVK